MIAYFDTSAVVKLLVDEDGSALAQVLWDEASIRITSLLTYAECRAALASAERSGRLTTRRGNIARDELDAHWDELVHVGVDESLVRDAGELAQTHALRGYDALHLASARVAADGGPISLVSWDAALVGAGIQSGLSVAP